MASTGKPVTLELAQAVLGTATSQAVLDLADALVARNAAAGLDVIHRTLDAGSDPRQFARQIVDYLRSLLLVAMGNAGQVEVTQEVRSQMARHAQALSPADLLRLLNIFNQAATEIRSSWQPALPLEMAFIQAITPAPLVAQAPPAAEKAVSRAPEPAVSKPARAGSGQAGESAAARPTPPAPVTQLVESSPEDNSLNQRLQVEWKEILRLLKLRDPSLSGLASSSNVQNIKNNVLRIGFKGEILPGRMNQTENVKVMQEVVKQVLGVELGIQGYAVSGSKSAPPPEVDGDGMVAAALRDLGGEIVDIQ